ncbi:DUF1275 domain-containing protein [Treponema zuelzerae]|uniref:DUF1275 domain-containing protein n=1 Tax=Teretinema zuelzerae TaxID=156 RepID=A0AAE3JII3_9SPIR|nr:YoaK family protein [Teretinema zuelzerae]MCD1654328.1 DUF1275 domain-containing protein [Teretinema zuelzerae]
MLSKLPAWVGIGAFLLAFAGGAINVVMILGPLAVPVSHLTGNSSNRAIDLARANISEAAHLFLLIAAFIGGSVLSGFIIRDSSLKLGRRYGFSLLVETLLIVCAWSLYEAAPAPAQLILSAACGLQNAMATTYSGAVVRTTHLTGIYTDLGILIGNRMAGIKPPKKKVKLFAALISGFLAGGLCAALAHPFWGRNALFLSASVTFSMALAYFVYRAVSKHAHRAELLAELAAETESEPR